MGASLQGPIPGQSLTMEPGNAPWEQPPLYADTQQVLAFYLEKLQDEDIMDDALFAFSQGFPISTFVESMTTVGVMEGYHTVDASILISPVLHEYLFSIAKAAGIDAVENEKPTKDEKAKATQKKRLVILLQKEFGDSLNDQTSEGLNPLEEEPEMPLPSENEEEPPLIPVSGESEAPPPPAKGLVPRRQ